MRDISLEKKSLNTQKPLKNKNSRTQTMHPSQDGRRANISLGRDCRNKPRAGELDLLHALATCLQDFHQLEHPREKPGPGSAPGAVDMLSGLGSCRDVWIKGEKASSDSLGVTAESGGTEMSPGTRGAKGTGWGGDPVMGTWKYPSMGPWLSRISFGDGMTGTANEPSSRDAS